MQSVIRGTHSARLGKNDHARPVGIKLAPALHNEPSTMEHLDEITAGALVTVHGGLPGWVSNMGTSIKTNKGTIIGWGLMLAIQPAIDGATWLFSKPPPPGCKKLSEAMPDLAASKNAQAGDVLCTKTTTTNPLASDK